MNITLLIDAIVRQTSVLVAQLAVAGGRPSLAHTSNQVFIDVVRELRQLGVGNKVIADMFGMALRTYHDRVKRLEQEARYGGCSLWEAVLAYIRAEQPVTQAELLTRFRKEDSLTLRGVIKDLADNGHVSRTGRGLNMTYRVASEFPEEGRVPLLTGGATDERRVANLVWVAVNRVGQCTFSQICEQVPSHEAALHTALELLVVEGKLSCLTTDVGVYYVANECVIHPHDPHGWEAAVFDHYQAMVQALCARLASAHETEIELTAKQDGGGSTYTYVVSEDHPLRDEVLGFLNGVRRQAESLRRRVAEYNASHPELLQRPLRVTTYVGQSAQQ